MSEEKKRLTSAANSSLPQASSIPDEETFQRVRVLLRDAIKAKVKQSEAEDKLKEIREELVLIAEAYGMKGFRHGLAGFQYDGYIRRKTLSKEALLASGVSAQIIEDAYIEGAEFVSAKIVAFDIE